MKKKDDYGFSLVELIIVVAVLAVLGTGLIRVSGVWDGWKVTKCTKLLESTLNRAKVQALSRGNVAGVEFYQLNGTYYAAIVSDIVKNKEPSSVFDLSDGSVIETVELGSAPIEITFEFKNTTGATTLTLTDNTGISDLKNVAAVAFNRSSGAIKSVKISGNDSDYTGIEITNSKRTVHYSVAYATGKITEN